MEHIESVVVAMLVGRHHFVVTIPKFWKAEILHFTAIISWNPENTDGFTQVKLSQAKYSAAA